MREEVLSLEVVRGRRVPGVQTGPGGTIVPLYTTAATGPEVTHYLVETLDGALALLREARATATQDVQQRIDAFIEQA